MYMNVDCGERVILVRTVVLLQHCGQMTNGLNDVFTQVVTIVPCTQMGRLLQESMVVSHVFLTEECMHDDIFDNSLKMESVVEQLNVGLTDVVHECESLECTLKMESSLKMDNVVQECDDLCLESNELLPDVLEECMFDEVFEFSDVVEDFVNDSQDTCDMSLDFTEISME